MYGYCALEKTVQYCKYWLVTVVVYNYHEWNQVLCWIQVLYWCVREEYPNIWCLLHNLIQQFPGKITAFILFSETVNWQSTYIRSEYVFNSRHCFVQGKDRLWAATRTSFIKAGQAPASYCVEAHLFTSGALQENRNFFLLTTAWNCQVSSTAYFWKTDLYQNVTQTTWVILKCW